MAKTEEACTRCGHARAAHEHYRRGTECSLCACPSYHGSSLLRRLFGRSRSNRD